MDELTGPGAHLPWRVHLVMLAGEDVKGVGFGFPTESAAKEFRREALRMSLVIEAVIKYVED